jgi:hypothetical protein
MLLKIQNVGEKKKPKKKKSENHRLPCTISTFPDLLALALQVCGPPSALSPGRGKKPGGRVALGTFLWSPPPLPVTGWAGCQVYYVPLAHSSTCASPCPSPPARQVSVHLLILLKLMGFPSPSLTTGSAVDGPPVWNQQGVPPLGPSLCTPPLPGHSRSCLVRFPSRVTDPAWHWEVVSDILPHTAGGESCPPTPDSRVQDIGGPTVMCRTLILKPHPQAFLHDPTLPTHYCPQPHWQNHL